MTQANNIDNINANQNQNNAHTEPQDEQSQNDHHAVTNIEKMTFAPYKNDHQSMQIGELIFENQTDKIIVYGDIDIVKNKKGLAQALKLQQVFNAIVDELQQAERADELDNAATNEGNVREQSQTSKIVDNPFS